MAMERQPEGDLMGTQRNRQLGKVDSKEDTLGDLPFRSSSPQRVTGSHKVEPVTDTQEDQQ